MFRWWRARSAPGVDGDNLPTDCTADPSPPGCGQPGRRGRWVPWEAAVALGAHVCGRGADWAGQFPQADVSIQIPTTYLRGVAGWLRAAIEKSAIGRNVRGQLREAAGGALAPIPGGR